MPSITWYGSFGTTSAGSDGISAAATSNASLPADATITNVTYWLSMSADKYSSDNNWDLHWFRVNNSSPSVPYSTAVMYNTEHTFSGNMSFSQADASAFRSTSINVHCKANNDHPTARSYLKDFNVTVYYEQYKLPTLDTSKPSDSTIISGEPITLSVAIATAGNPASYAYQWYKNGSAVSGATSSTYTDKPTSDSSYYCVVSNAAGKVTSRTASVTVLHPPTLSNNYPSDATIKRGTSTYLEVKTATAGNPSECTYQWYENGEAIEGATKASCTVSPQVSSSYYCEVSNVAGTVTSRTAAVTVRYPPVLDPNYPADAELIPGKDTTLAVRIAEDGNPATYTYQWYKNDEPIVGEVSANLTVAAGNTAKYYCVVSNTVGTVRSRTAVVSARSGGSILIDGAWVPATAYVYNGESWVNAEVYCYKDGAWQPCSGS